MPIIHEILAANDRYANRSETSGRLLEAEPQRAVLILTCMDARIDVYRAFGLELGDAHVLRNAGGVVTEDVVRSIALSQHVLGTRSILIVKHTKCGLMSATEEEIRTEIGRRSGTEPDFAIRAFDSLEAELRNSRRILAESPFIPFKDDIRTLIFDVDTGRLSNVE